MSGLRSNRNQLAQWNNREHKTITVYKKNYAKDASP